MGMGMGMWMGMEMEMEMEMEKVFCLTISFCELKETRGTSFRCSAIGTTTTSSLGAIMKLDPPFNLFTHTYTHDYG